MLRDGFPDEHYRLGKELARVEEREGEVVAHFADGTREAGDLLVAADGFRSGVRAQYLPDVQPLYAGYVAWRGLVDERAFAPDVHRDLFDTSPSACRPASSCSAIRSPGPATTCARGTASTTSSGTARPTRRRSCRGC